MREKEGGTVTCSSRELQFLPDRKQETELLLAVPILSEIISEAQAQGKE